MFRRGFPQTAQDVIFSVADTGIGIAPEHQSIIFQEFAQLENRLTAQGARHRPGTAAVEEAGANCWAARFRSRANPGWDRPSRLRIPLVYTAAQPFSDVVLAPELDQARLPVLVIEDEIETRLLYEKYLRGTGFQPVPARNLREARTLLETIRPAAIILDILLRGEDSWGLLPELKTNPETRDIPVLVITNVDDRQKALSLGADAFAQKPVARRWLLDQLHTVHRPQRAAQGAGDRRRRSVALPAAAIVPSQRTR